MKYFIIFLILLCAAGCSSVPKVSGIDFHLGKHEHGLWFDSDEKQYDPNGWGVKFSILYGKLVDPYGKWGENPWNGDKPVFVLRSPFIIFPYISISLGEFGFYLGVKPYEVWAPKHMVPDSYGPWWKDEVGTKDNRAEFLCFTATIRRTRWK